MDNQFIEGSSTPISRTDADGNTYQNRTLQNGEQHEILKNFPTEQELVQTFREQGKDIHYHDFIYFWSADYRVK
ncbi:MAG: hypothetical protein ACOY3I_10050 [Verrucomicrobiota bacterium]